MSNLCSFIFWNYVASIVITCKSVSKGSCTFITVIAQLKAFFLNLSTSITISKQLNIPWKDLFKRNTNIYKKNFSRFFRKTLRSNLKMLLHFLIYWWLTCFSRCSGGVFFRAGDIFFWFQSFSQICEILIQSMFFYSMVLMQNNTVCGFTFIGKVKSCNW